MYFEYNLMEILFHLEYMFVEIWKESTSIVYFLLVESIVVLFMNENDIISMEMVLSPW